MSHIVLTWELGSHLGHIGRFLPLALALREQGNEVSFIVKDLSRTYALLSKYGFEVFQSPLWLLKPQNIKSPPVNFAELLIHFGYLDANGLTGVALAWQALFKMLAPDLVLFDHSPTALLAARGFTFKKALFGSGFFHPPHTVPMPAFREDENSPAHRLLRSEERVLRTVNTVAENTGQAPLEQLYDLFNVDEDFLLTLAELDHYPNRKNARYWGVISGNAGGVEPRWPQGEGKKLFAYLKPEYSKTEQVLEAITALSSQSISTLVYAPNLPEVILNRFSSDSLMFCRERFDLPTLADECDIGICHGGHDTTSILLMGATPVLLLPMQQEQMILASNVEKLGLGLIGYEHEATNDYIDKLETIITRLDFQKTVDAFAAKYQGSTQLDALEQIFLRCQELVGKQ